MSHLVAKRDIKPSSKHKEKGKKNDGLVLAEDLRMVADKGYPDLEDEAKKQIVLNHYLGQTEHTQVAFNVKKTTVN